MLIVGMLNQSSSKYISGAGGPSPSLSYDQNELQPSQLINIVKATGSNSKRRKQNKILKDNAVLKEEFVLSKSKLDIDLSALVKQQNFREEKDDTRQ